MQSRSLVLLAALAVSVGTSGCGGDPYAQPDPAPAKEPTIAVSTTPEAHAPSARVATPDAAVRAFANTFINWTFANLPQLRRRLAQRSIGQLRATLLDESEQALTQTSRRVSNQANSGQVQLVGPPDTTGMMLVITRETARLGDLKAQTGHFIYQAKVSRYGNTYKLAEFKAIN